jgi:hypothetical protein
VKVPIFFKFFMMGWAVGRIEIAWLTWLEVVVNLILNLC